MKFYINNNKDPYFNMAAEEFLLRHTCEDIVMLWRNAPAVIIGKNQNVFAEVNLDFTEEKGIKVVRRLTGGGAVFHDPGNLNFTFISHTGGELARGRCGEGIDFACFAEPIIDALRSLGVAVRLSGRNDIVSDTIDGERKLSGNAQTVLDGVTMHHGTLLFSADTGYMSGALRVDNTKLRSKGIASVRSRIVNIRDLLTGGTDMDIEGFIRYLEARLSARYGVSAEPLPEGMCASIWALAKEKYACDSWNFRKMASFGKLCEHRFAFGKVTAELLVKDGIIADVRFSGDYFGEGDTALLEASLRGVEFSRSAILSAVDEGLLSRCIFGASACDMAALLTESFSVS